MQINTLKPRNKNKVSRRVGRGGKRGTTAGRGTKGQKSRAGHRMRPEFRDMIKKLPKMRGRGKNSNKSIQEKPQALNLSILEKHFVAGDTVSPKTLVEKGVLSRSRGSLPVVKILGTGALTKKLTISGCTVSASAQAAIEARGGNIATKQS